MRRCRRCSVKSPITPCIDCDRELAHRRAPWPGLPGTNAQPASLDQAMPSLAKAYRSFLWLGPRTVVRPLLQ